MSYEEAKERFENFGTFCDDYNEACDGDCEKCSNMEDRIIEALEKQIPKKPNNDVDTTWGIRKSVNVCPKCDYYLGNYAFINTKDILKKNKVIYCETCGQAIDFSEVE